MSTPFSTTGRQRPDGLSGRQRATGWRRPAAVLIGLLALAGLLAGCASSTPSAGGGPDGSSSGGRSSTAGGSTTTGPGMGGTASVPPSSSSVASAAAATCPASPAQVNPLAEPGAKPVPADLSVAWVLRCEVLSTGGNPSTLVASRSTSDPAAFVTALRAPSAQRAKVVCPMFRVQLPYLALVTAQGSVFVPKVPLNNCGQAQTDVVTTLHQLQFTEISSRPVK